MEAHEDATGVEMEEVEEEVEGDGSGDALEPIEEEKPRKRSTRQAAIAWIYLYPKEDGVHVAARDENGRVVRMDDEIFATVNMAKRTLHARYPEARIR